MRGGARNIPHLAIDRTLRQPELRGGRMARQRRREKRLRCVEPAFAAQKIGEIDEGFDALRFDRQHPAEKILCRPGKT